MRPQEAAGVDPRPRPRLAPERVGIVSFTLEDCLAADASGEMATPQKIRILTVTLAVPGATGMGEFAAKK